MSDLVIGDYTAAATIDGGTHYLLIQPGSAATAYKKINRNVLLGVTGDPADISTAQNVTNKTLNNTNTITLKDTLFTLQDDGDTTKQAKFQLSGITTATTRTYTLPNASSTLADIATAQTFTNKTLTSPTITGGTYDNGTITVDSIGEHTAANGVTVDGLNIKDGKLNTNNSVVTANVTDTAITPAKLQAGTGAGWSWSSWVPAFTNFSLGNGTLSYAKYIQIGKTVIIRMRVVLGNTSAVSSQIIVSLPVTMNADLNNDQAPLTQYTRIKDSGTAFYEGLFVWASTTSIALNAKTAGGTYVGETATSSTVPMTWTNADEFSTMLMYEAA